MNAKCEAWLSDCIAPDAFSSTGDAARALKAFYARLGFAEKSRWPDEYLIVSRDDCEIHFWVCEDAELCENSSCYVYVEDAAALYAEYLANGIAQMEAPAATDYDVLESRSSIRTAINSHRIRRAGDDVNRTFADVSRIVFS